MPKQTILVIDDEKDILKLLQYSLEKEGYQVLLSKTGEEGLELARNKRPDLIILDLMLPDMEGFQVCKELRRICSPWSVPIVMLTALSEPVDRLKGFAHGADAYLTKPCRTEELLDTIERLL